MSTVYHKDHRRSF